MTDHKELVDWAYSVMPTPKTTTEEMPFDMGDWVYQPKLDGKRCIAVVTPTYALLLSKHRKLFSHLEYPELSGDYSNVGSFGIFDCELLGEHLWVFDTFVLNGKPLDNLSWQTRRQMSPDDLLVGSISLRLLPCYYPHSPALVGFEWVRDILSGTGRVEGVIARREHATLMGRPTVFKQKP